MTGQGMNDATEAAAKALSKYSDAWWATNGDLAVAHAFREHAERALAAAVPWIRADIATEIHAAYVGADIATARIIQDVLAKINRPVT